MLQRKERILHQYAKIILAFYFLLQTLAHERKHFLQNNVMCYFIWVLSYTERKFTRRSVMGIIFVQTISA